MLCLSLKTAACRFCLRFFVFNDTYEVRKKGVIQINKKGQIKKCKRAKKTPSAQLYSCSNENLDASAKLWFLPITTKAEFRNKSKEFA